jgi:hypothetical protein
MMKLKPILLLALLSIAASHARAADDIAGIRIGVPLAEQREAIAKVNSKYKLTDLQSKKGKVVGVSAVSADYNDKFLALAEEDGIVWFVGRKQSFKEGERIKEDALIDALKEKYGSSYTYMGSSAVYWHFDRQGKIYQEGRKNPCVDRGNPTDVIGFSVPKTFAPDCGITIDAVLSTTPERDLVHGFTVTIADMKRPYDRLVADAKAEEDERLRKLEAERAKNIKPKL